LEVKNRKFGTNEVKMKGGYSRFRICDETNKKRKGENLKTY
jgi:hypothetical protein